MNEEARRIWKTPEGASLFQSMLAGLKPDQVSPEQRETLERLKRADPPNPGQAAAHSEGQAPRRRMNDEAWAIWNSPAGVRLLGNMMAGIKPDQVDPQDRQTLDRLKQTNRPQTNHDTQGGSRGMNEEARRLWATPGGASILRKWAQQEPLDLADLAHLAAIRDTGKRSHERE